MSYCRFSSDCWQSDVYAYEDVGGGFRIFVRTHRPGAVIPPLDHSSVAALNASLQVEREALARAGKVPIGLPADGQVYSEDNLADLLARLLSLQALGYHVPESALTEIRAEMEGKG